ncbi:putative glycine cleavage system protein H [Paratrimastix pyriformis]|uniref:Glycine cleavage system H protein n=1 Tax=Paratrimastix pyriformis TaxID=342808 RepID=B0F467_9EUKA|nr:glycine cleavage system protein H [Paratrimastix pyriformis]KAJ4462643.1 putative glycine cleavage system protein H [Paratrimastix pyriformis]
MQRLFSVVPAVGLSFLARFAGEKFYTKDHEWVDESGLVGISDYAQKHLGQIVYVDLPEIGKEVAQKDTLTAVESVKAASDVFAPVAGTVEKVNEKLRDNAGLINKAAETDGWIAKISIKDTAEFGTLMNAEKYADFLKTQH